MTSRLNIKDIVDPTYPLLEAKRASINAIQRATYAYGSTDAHQLDVYYPPSSGSAQAGGDSRPPIVVFFHGGSLIHGSRCSPPQYLVHNNLGAYFASRGMLAVIADYRLVPNAVFPQGAEDVRDALLWVTEHVPEGDPTQIYVLGHSAGGIHVANMLLLPHLFQLQLRQALRGVVLIGVPYEIPGGKMSELQSAATQYYGGVRNIALNQPLGLLRRAGTGGHITILPPIRNIIGENEPRSIKGAARAFSKLFREKGGVLEDFTLQGHDHISSILALSTDVGEEWAQEIVNWISRCGAAPCGQDMACTEKRMKDELIKSPNYYF